MIHGAWSENPEKEDTFRLINGRYASETPVRDPKSLESASPTLAVPDAAALNAQGLLLMRKGDYDDAARKFSEAAKRAPENAEFANNAGFALYKRGSYQMAVVWLDKATQLDPERSIAYLNLGDALSKIDSKSALTAARDAYRRYLELAPDSKAAPDVRKKLEALQSSP